MKILKLEETYRLNNKQTTLFALAFWKFGLSEMLEHLKSKNDNGLKENGRWLYKYYLWWFLNFVTFSVRSFICTMNQGTWLHFNKLTNTWKKEENSIKCYLEQLEQHHLFVHSHKHRADSSLPLHKYQKPNQIITETCHPTLW